MITYDSIVTAVSELSMHDVSIHPESLEPGVPGVLDLFWHFGQLGMQRLLGKGVAADFSSVDSAVSRQADSADWSRSILCGLLCKCPQESLSTPRVANSGRICNCRCCCCWAFNRWPILLPAPATISGCLETRSGFHGTYAHRPVRLPNIRVSRSCSRKQHHLNCRPFLPGGQVRGHNFRLPTACHPYHDLRIM